MSLMAGNSSHPESLRTAVTSTGAPQLGHDGADASLVSRQYRQT